MLLNFTWWLNRLDPEGNDIFGGGFLGLDNISPIDRSSLPPGVNLAQADGTAWMASYALGMLGSSRRLAERDTVYEDMVVKSTEQYLMIVDAMERSGSTMRTTAGATTDSRRRTAPRRSGPDADRGHRPAPGRLLRAGDARVEPCTGSNPAWQGLLWFPEYFHGDTGAGLGAMHQTGWTAEVINLLVERPTTAS